MSMKYLEVSAVAKKLNVSTSTVYRLIKQKKLIVSKNGVSAGIRVLKNSVTEFEEMRIAERD